MMHVLLPSFLSILPVLSSHFHYTIYNSPVLKLEQWNCCSGDMFVVAASMASSTRKSADKCCCTRSLMPCHAISGIRKLRITRLTHTPATHAVHVHCPLCLWPHFPHVPHADLCPLLSHIDFWFETAFANN